MVKYYPAQVLWVTSKLLNIKNNKRHLAEIAVGIYYERTLCKETTTLRYISKKLGMKKSDVASIYRSEIIWHKRTTLA